MSFGPFGFGGVWAWTRRGRVGRTNCFYLLYVQDSIVVKVVEVEAVERREQERRV